LRAPLGVKEFRSYGASHSYLNSDSINIPPHCGCSANDTRQLVLRLGLLCVKGLRGEAGRAIVSARAQRPFTSIDDLHYRVPELRKDELRKLAAVGALNLLGARASRPLVFINHNHVGRSEEHTSELQSRGHLVCRLLL